MRLFRLIMLLLVPLIMGDCTITEQTQQPIPPLPGDPLATARDLEKQGRLGEAIYLLEEATAQSTKPQIFRTSLHRLRLKKATLEQELRDRILLERSKAIQKELSLMVQLIRSDPGDNHLGSRLMDKGAEMQNYKQALSECGRRQSSRDPVLAKQCLSLALAIRKDDQDQELLDQLLKKEQETEEIRRLEQLKALNKQKKKKNQERLHTAEQLIRSSNLADARQLLSLVLKEDPKNTRAEILLSQLRSQIGDYLDHLLQAGDRLYRDSEIEGAKAVWQAALNLDPEDVRARERIERAQRVLDNLETLRQAH